MIATGDRKKILNVLNKAINRQKKKRCFCKLITRVGLASTTINKATDPERGNPNLSTLVQILNALGYELYVRPRRFGKTPDGEKPETLPAGAIAELE